MKNNILIFFSLILLSPAFLNAQCTIHRDDLKEVHRYTKDAFQHKDESVLKCVMYPDSVDKKLMGASGMKHVKSLLKEGHKFLRYGLPEFKQEHISINDTEFESVKVGQKGKKDFCFLYRNISGQYWFDRIVVMQEFDF